MQLEHLRSRLTARRLGFEVSPNAKAWLVEHGYDPVFGARPLKRLIQKEIGDPLARALLGGGYLEGMTVRVDTTTSAPTNADSSDGTERLVLL